MRNSMPGKLPDSLTGTAATGHNPFGSERVKSRLPSALQLAAVRGMNTAAGRRKYAAGFGTLERQSGPAQVIPFCRRVADRRAGDRRQAQK